MATGAMMAVKIRDDNTDFPGIDELTDDQLDNFAENVRNGEVIASDSGDWVDALIEGGNLAAIHESLSDEINLSSKAQKKWSRGEERYGSKLRALRATYEEHQSNVQRLFTAATRGLA